MTVVLAWTQFFVIGAMTYSEFKRKSPVVFCWATLFLMFGIMHVFTVYITGYQYGDTTLNTASLFVILFCMFYCAARLFLRGAFHRYLSDKENTSIKLRDENILSVINVVLLFSVLLYGFFVVRVSGSLAGVNKDNVYSTMATGGMWFILSSYLYYSTAPIILYYIIKKNKKMVIYTSGLIIIRSLLSQSRMDMVIIFVGIICAMILNQKKQDIKTVIILALMSFVVIYAVYALRTFRYYYDFYSLFSIDIGEFNEKLIEFIKTDNGELGLRQVFYYFIDNNNAFDGFGNGAGYIRVLMLPIPTGLSFGLKPEDMCVVMGRAWRPDANGIINFTMTPTLFGDCYANLGFWGCTLGAFWGFFATITDVLCNRRNEIISILLFCICATLFVDIGRGSVYNPLALVFYGCIFILAYRILSRIKIRKLRFSIRGSSSKCRLNSVHQK